MFSSESNTVVLGILEKLEEVKQWIMVPPSGRVWQHISQQKGKFCNFLLKTKN